jgi:hypothetical protein
MAVTCLSTWPSSYGLGRYWLRPASLVKFLTRRSLKCRSVYLVVHTQHPVCPASFWPCICVRPSFFSLCTTSFPRYTARTLSLSSTTAEFCHCKHLRQNSFVAAPSVPRFVLSNDHFPALLSVFSTTDVATVRGRSACLGLSGFLLITPVGRALDSVGSCSIPVSCLIWHTPEQVLKYIYISQLK